MAIIGDVFPEHRRGAATGALMSAFALASVAGVPFGLSLGTAYGWHVPFLLLAGAGSVALIVAMKAMPFPFEGTSIRKKSAGHPLKEMVATLTHPNHLGAFALIVTLMLGSFAVVPYISPYLVANVGVTEKQLPWVYVVGGGLDPGRRSLGRQARRSLRQAAGLSMCGLDRRPLDDRGHLLTSGFPHSRRHGRLASYGR